MQAIVALEMQYRMAADIQLLSNTLVYEGCLRCGSDAVRDRMLQTRIPATLDCPQWLLEVGSPALDRAASTVSQALTV